MLFLPGETLFSAALQYVVSRGFGLLMPNVRGSFGFGKEFERLDDGRYNIVLRGLQSFIIDHELPRQFGYNMPLELVLKHLNTNELFRLSWGAKNTHGVEWEALRKTFEERLDEMTRAALREKWLRPQGVFGIFPCQSDGDDLVVYDPQTINTASPDELTRFACPRVPRMAVGVRNVRRGFSIPPNGKAGARRNSNFGHGYGTK